MIPPIEITAVDVEDSLECAEKKAVAGTPNNRKIPVAYEEVTLTEEAEQILEKERKAAAERPARKLRRMALGAAATPGAESNNQTQE